MKTVPPYGGNIVYTGPIFKDYSGAFKGAYV